MSVINSKYLFNGLLRSRHFPINLRLQTAFLSTGFSSDVPLPSILNDLANPETWENEYKSGRQPSWYCSSKTIAPVLSKIIKDRSFLSPDRTNILLEIGCGTAPILPRLLGKKWNNSIIGVTTDVSPKCLEIVKGKYGDNKATNKRNGGPKYKTRVDEFNNFQMLYPRMYCSLLDVSNISPFIKTLQYFLLRDKSIYREYPEFQRNEESFRNRIIIVDKGCLDVFVFSKQPGPIKTVIDSCDVLLSVTNEDPDTRTVYFQDNFGRRPNVHFVPGSSDLFCYSVSNLG